MTNWQSHKSVFPSSDKILVKGVFIYLDVVLLPTAAFFRGYCDCCGPSDKLVVHDNDLLCGVLSSFSIATIIQNLSLFVSVPIVFAMSQFMV